MLPFKAQRSVTKRPPCVEMDVVSKETSEVANSTSTVTLFSMTLQSSLFPKEGERQHNLMYEWGGQITRLARFNTSSMFFRFFRFSSQTCQNKQGPLTTGMCRIIRLVPSKALERKIKFWWAMPCLFCFFNYSQPASAFIDVTTHAAIHGVVCQ